MGFLTASAMVRNHDTYHEGKGHADEKEKAKILSKGRHSVASNKYSWTCELLGVSGPFT